MFNRSHRVFRLPLFSLWVADCKLGKHTTACRINKKHGNDRAADESDDVSEAIITLWRTPIPFGKTRVGTESVPLRHRPAVVTRRVAFCAMCRKVLVAGDIVYSGSK